MGLAYTGFIPVNLVYAPSSRASIISTYTSVLTSAGWSVSLTAGGIVARATSTQGLQIDMFVVDLGHRLGPSFAPTATVYFQTTDTLITGFQHEVCADGRARNLIIGVSQVFDSIIGVDTENQGGTFCGGIPFFPLVSVCSQEVPALATTRGFWAMSDYNFGVTPRTSLIMGTNFGAPDSRNNCEALWNSSYCAPSNPVGSVRIPALTPSAQIFQAFNISSPTLWYNGDYLIYEPALVWGTTNATLPSIRAQIWDAAIFSKQFPMDQPVSVQGTRWITFTNNYLFGTLALLTPFPGGVPGNYAYTTP